MKTIKFGNQVFWYSQRNNGVSRKLDQLPKSSRMLIF